MKRKHGRKRKKAGRNTYALTYLFSLILINALILLGVFLFRRHQENLKAYPSDAGFSISLVTEDPEKIPDFSGEDAVILENGIPRFNEYDITHLSGEHFQKLDSFGRCGPAFAMIDPSMRPVKQREWIGMIRPTGWHQAKYEGLVDSDPPYLYNRCHLIPYALTGQNANVLNLITGTRYMNAVSMLSFEVSVMDYLEKTGNHVLYRVTPYFRADELLARGVEMEAWSVEDRGKGVCFHVFVYNRQPGVEIDYRTGKSRVKQTGRGHFL